MPGVLNMGYGQRYGMQIVPRSNTDPLPGINGIWSNLGSSTPVGLYQDVTCTIPATSDFDPVAGWKDERNGVIIATQSDVAKQPFVLTVLGRAVVQSDGIDDGMITGVNLLNPFSIGVAGAVTVTSENQRLLQSRDDNRVFTFNRGNASVFLGGVVVANTGTIPGANPGIGTLTDAATASCFINGVDVTSNPAFSADWGRVSFMGEGTNPEVPVGYLAGFFWKVGGVWTPTDIANIEAFAATILP